MPAFISKIPGQAQHFIGKIKYTSKETDLDKAVADFVANGFTKSFEDIEDEIKVHMKD